MKILRIKNFYPKYFAHLKSNIAYKYSLKVTKFQIFKKLKKPCYFYLE